MKNKCTFWVIGKMRTFLYILKITTTYFNLILFILESLENRVVEGFLRGFCVPERGILFTFQGEDVYHSGDTCVGIRGMLCTFEGMGITGKVHKNTKSEISLYKILHLVYNCCMQCTCLVHII